MGYIEKIMANISFLSHLTTRKDGKQSVDMFPFNDLLIFLVFGSYKDCSGIGYGKVP